MSSELLDTIDYYTDSYSSSEYSDTARTTDGSLDREKNEKSAVAVNSTVMIIEEVINANKDNDNVRQKSFDSNDIANGINVVKNENIDENYNNKNIVDNDDTVNETASQIELSPRKKSSKIDGENSAPNTGSYRSLVSSSTNSEHSATVLSTASSSSTVSGSESVTSSSSSSSSSGSENVCVSNNRDEALQNPMKSQQSHQNLSKTHFNEEFTYSSPAPSDQDSLPYGHESSNETSTTDYSTQTTTGSSSHSVGTDEIRSSTSTKFNISEKDQLHFANIFESDPLFLRRRRGGGGGEFARRQTTTRDSDPVGEPIRGADAPIGSLYASGSAFGAQSALDLSSASLLRGAPLLIGNGLLQAAAYSNSNCNNNTNAQSSAASSAGNIIFTDGVGNATRSPSLVATTTSSSSRPLIPYLAHYSDSGFSSFSSCTYLPPPPPYRQRASAPADGGGDEENLSPAGAAARAGATRFHFDFSRTTAVATGGGILRRKSSAKSTRASNLRATQANSGSGANMKIHRSLSDSKYRLLYVQERAAASGTTFAQKIGSSNSLNVANAAALITSSFSNPVNAAGSQQERDQSDHSVISIKPKTGSEHSISILEQLQKEQVEIQRKQKEQQATMDQMDFTGTESVQTTAFPSGNIVENPPDFTSRNVAAGGVGSNVMTRSFNTHVQHTHTRQYQQQHRVYTGRVAGRVDSNSGTEQAQVQSRIQAQTREMESRNLSYNLTPFQKGQHPGQGREQCRNWWPNPQEHLQARIRYDFGAFRPQNRLKSVPILFPIGAYDDNDANNNNNDDEANINDDDEEEEDNDEEDNSENNEHLGGVLDQSQVQCPNRDQALELGCVLSCEEWLRMSSVMNASASCAMSSSVSMLNLSTDCATPSACMTSWNATGAASSTARTAGAGVEPTATTASQQKLQRWTIARDELALQISLIEKRTSEQKERLRELEALLDAKRETFAHCGAAPRDAADIVDEIAALKRDCAGLQREKLNAQRRLNIANVEVNRIQPNFRQQNFHILPRANRSSDETLRNVDEVEKLLQTIQQLVTDNQQKNLEISSLRKALDHRFAGGTTDSTGVTGHTPTSGRLSSPSFDINAQLKRLLLDEELLEEGSPKASGSGVMAHSCSFPMNLSTGGHQAAAGGDIAQFRRDASHAFFDRSVQSSNGAMEARAPLSARYPNLSPHVGCAGTSGMPTSTSYTSGLGNNSFNAYSRGAPTATAAAFASAAAALWATASPPEACRTSSTFYYDSGSPMNASYSASARATVGGGGASASSSPAAARQLAAELEELRQSGEFQRIAHRFSSAAFLSPLYAARGGGGSSGNSASLPRTIHSNSMSAGLSLPRQSNLPYLHMADGRASCSSDEPLVPFSLSHNGFLGSREACGSSRRRAVVLAADASPMPVRRAAPTTRFASVGAMKKARASSRSIRSLLFPSCVGARNDALYRFEPASPRDFVHITAAHRSTSVPNLRGLPCTYIDENDEEYCKCDRNPAEVFGEFASDDDITTAAARATRRRTRADAKPSAAKTTKRPATGGRTRSALRSLFGRLARSSSQDLRHNREAKEDGARGDAISTRDQREYRGAKPAAGMRLSIGTSDSSPGTTTGTANGAECSPLAARPPVQEFVDWTSAQVCAWLTGVDLAQYAPYATRFVRSGRHLLNMTETELEKELQIKSGFHRRRLKCLLDCIERNTGQLVEPADRMGIHQVMLWLDDIGVPQFRDTFAAQRVDGQLLLCLTAADLVELRITSAMNHATFARAIQLLRAIEFRVHRLEKRYGTMTPAVPGPTVIESSGSSPADVERWTAACVADWLRGIDLDEFTPNLMFAGVHGALMVNEPTFTAESLAEVLQIPAHKTLLRRHLTTHFNNALGHEVIARKRDALAQPFVTHLSPSLRIKLVKKGFLGARKKSKNDIFVEPHVPLCPTSRLAHDPAEEEADTVKNGAHNLSANSTDI